jgi:tRNA (mo5U34)-methyltransferase
MPEFRLTGCRQVNFYSTLYQQLETMGLADWSRQLQQVLPKMFSPDSRREMAEWQQVLESLPDFQPTHVDLKEGVEIGRGEELGDKSRNELIEQLKAFHPWRKGPFRLFGVDIDAEWRSDWKWRRLLPYIQPLDGRKVLDVGCGNGYHGWRMRGAGAEFVLGIDPVMTYIMQFWVIQRYLNDPNHHLLPLRIEEIPANLGCFDSVFSMGVLYHRRSPLDHLLELKGCLRSGGELILETLVVEGDVGTIFTPQGRYAKMRNIWFVPSVEALSLWLRRCGFKDVICVDINRTGLDEQRRTAWMWEESLADFLDPDDNQKTIEGHPAPLRAIFTSTKP